MPIFKKSLVILLFTICVYGCKKSEPTKTETPDPIPREVKGVEILRGNDQIGYKGEQLDTIIIKVKLNSSGDNKPLPYYIRMSSNNDRFFVHSQTRSGDDMIIKALWQPSGTQAIPTVKFYVSADCDYDQLAKGTCAKADSVSLTARFRQPWKSVYLGSQGGYNVLQDVHFINEMNGIAIGEGSGVVRTSDGGKSWGKGEPVRSDNSAYIISFTGRDTALVSIVNNYASFTYDGGKTFFQPDNWTPPFIGHQSSSAFYFQCRNVIYSVGWRGGIAKTVDGGKNWDKSGSFNVLNGLTGLTHIGKDTLFTCGSVGFIARTTDAGRSWRQQPVQLNNQLNTIYFINNKIGFAAGQYGVLIRTTDGGEHWEKIPTGMSFSIIAIRFFKNGHGFLVSSGGEVAESNDAGLNWTLRIKSNYGANDLRKAEIKDEKSIFGVQQSSILTYDLTLQ
jgi:photosystem II stability/assembly factor-like uncharacterized protein